MFYLRHFWAFRGEENVVCKSLVNILIKCAYLRCPNPETTTPSTIVEKGI